MESNKKTLEKADNIIKENAKLIRETELYRKELITGIDNGTKTAELLLVAADIIRMLSKDEIVYNHILDGLIRRGEI